MNDYKEIDGARYYRPELHEEPEQQMSGVDLAINLVMGVIILGLMFVGLMMFTHTGLWAN